MLKAAAVRKYQKFWIKRAAARNAKNKKDELPWDEEYSTLRRLCEALLSDEDRRIVEEIIMDDLVERTIDDDATASYGRLVKALQDPKSGFNPNCYLSDGATPLHVVAKAGFSDCVRTLIQHGADVNAIHLQLGHSVLHTAAMVGSHACMNLLINAGANRAYVNALPGKRRSSLHYAAENGSAPCLLLLLHSNAANVLRRNQETQEVRAILDVQDAFGNTALHLACVDGSEDCVRLLIESGASPVVRNAEGKTAVDVARAMASGGGSDSSRAVLFMVMAAAGLDPLDPSVTDTLPVVDAESSGGADGSSPDGRSRPGSLSVPNLLDGASASAAGQGEPEDLRYSNGEGVLWVIVKDGLLISSTGVGREEQGNPSLNPNPSAGPGWQRRAPSAGKVSKRLRFVRRSMLGGPADTEAEAETEGGDEGTGPAGAAGPSSLSRPGGNPRVEVFRSRREAEERVRAVHYPSALADAASSSSGNGNSSSDSVLIGLKSAPNGIGAAPSIVRGGGPGGGPAGAAGPWGSARHRSSSGSAPGDAATASATVAEASKGTGSLEGAGTWPAPVPVPAPQFYTAFIDAAQLAVFRARVPHYYPNNSQNGHSPFSAVRASGLAFNSARRVVPAADAAEDPLWAQFQLERARSSSSIKAGTAQGQVNGGDSRYQDTSRSNRPLRLMPPAAASPTAATPADGGASPAQAAGPGSDQGRPASQTQETGSGRSGRLLNREQAAARRLELSTEVAALQAQVFDRLCRLTDLQEAVRARAATAVTVEATAVTQCCKGWGSAGELGSGNTSANTEREPSHDPRGPSGFASSSDRRQEEAKASGILIDFDGDGAGGSSGRSHDGDDDAGPHVAASASEDWRAEDRVGVVTDDHPAPGPQHPEPLSGEGQPVSPISVEAADSRFLEAGGHAGSTGGDPRVGADLGLGLGLGLDPGLNGITDCPEEDGLAAAASAVGLLRSRDDRMMDGIVLSMHAELQLEQDLDEGNLPGQERQLSEEGEQGLGPHWAE